MKLTYLSVVLAAFSSAMANDADITAETHQPAAAAPLAVVRVDSRPPYSDALEQREFRADRVRELTSQLSGLALDQRAVEQISAKPDFKSYLLKDKALVREELEARLLPDTSSLFDTSALKEICNLDVKSKVDFRSLVDVPSSSKFDINLKVNLSKLYKPVPQPVLEAQGFGGGQGSPAVGYYGAPITSMDMGAPVFYESFGAAPIIHPYFAYFPPMPCGCVFLPCYMGHALLYNICALIFGFEEII